MTLTTPPADTRMMGIVHSALRRDLERAKRVLSAAPPPSLNQRVALVDHLAWMMHFLHGHHSGEDRGLWPLIRDLNPAAGPMLDVMDADHVRIATEIERVTAATTAYRSDPAAREDLSRSLEALAQVLLPHLRREEDEMMPVVARTLTQRQLDEVEQREFIAPKTKQELGIEAHWVIDSVDREAYDVAVHTVGPVARFVLLHAFSRPYRRACAVRWGADMDVSPRLQRSWRTEGSVDLWIDAPAGQLYDAVADVTRTGERSPECYACSWLPGRPRGAVGSRFRGYCRARHTRWSRMCEVTAADPGATFAFRTASERFNPLKHDSTTWLYTFVAEAGGTRVTHAYRLDIQPYRPLQWLYGYIFPQHRDMRPQMRQNLEALREHAPIGIDSASDLPGRPTTRQHFSRTDRPA